MPDGKESEDDGATTSQVGDVAGDELQAARRHSIEHAYCMQREVSWSDSEDDMIMPVETVMGSDEEGKESQLVFNVSDSDSGSEDKRRVDVVERRKVPMELQCLSVLGDSSNEAAPVEGMPAPPELQKIPESLPQPKVFEREVYPMPALTKMRESPTWDVEYLEDESSPNSLLENLFNEAGRINEENFERFNQNISSEEVEVERKVKLDALKRFIGEEEVKEETLVRKPEIKVKTVETINEGFAKKDMSSRLMDLFQKRKKEETMVVVVDAELGKAVEHKPVPMRQIVSVVRPDTGRTIKCLRTVPGTTITRIVSPQKNPYSVLATKKSPAYTILRRKPVEENRAAVASEHNPPPLRLKKTSINLEEFSNFLQPVLPENWFLMNHELGLQLGKMNLDQDLNPSILVSMVVATCGKITVNVRGQQLPYSHPVFTDLPDIATRQNKLRILYILTLLDRLRHFAVCSGCDNLDYKKYWSDDGFIEYYTEFQQTYRSHHCELLISTFKKRCYSCRSIQRTLRDRARRDRQPAADLSPKEMDEMCDIERRITQKNSKRRLEEFLEESFSSMRLEVEGEMKRREGRGEEEAVERRPETQEEVLSFMGLARTNSLGRVLRKSKREKKTNTRFEADWTRPPPQSELEELGFLQSHWSAINTLFSTSLLFGAYSRTGGDRLRENCRMFHQLLSTWKEIVVENPACLGCEDAAGFIDPELLADKDFEAMDLAELRQYSMNSVKEVNRLKSKLKTKNPFFKDMYNKHVKKRASRENGASSGSVPAAETPEAGSDEDSRFSMEISEALRVDESKKGV